MSRRGAAKAETDAQRVSLLCQLPLASSTRSNHDRTTQTVMLTDSSRSGVPRVNPSMFISSESRLHSHPSHQAEFISEGAAQQSARPANHLAISH